MQSVLAFGRNVDLKFNIKDIIAVPIHFIKVSSCSLNVFLLNSCFCFSMVDCSLFFPCHFDGVSFGIISPRLFPFVPSIHCNAFVGTRFSFTEHLCQVCRHPHGFQRNNHIKHWTYISISSSSLELFVLPITRGEQLIPRCRQGNASVIVVVTSSSSGFPPTSLIVQHVLFIPIVNKRWMWTTTFHP